MLLYVKLYNSFFYVYFCAFYTSFSAYLFVIAVVCPAAIPSVLADRKLHAIIDQLNPDLRAVEVRDGKTRAREFYAMSPEAAFNLLKAMAELHGFEDRLHLREKTGEDKESENNAAKAEGAKKRLETFRFSLVDIPVGAEVRFKDDENEGCQSSKRQARPLRRKRIFFLLPGAAAHRQRRHTLGPAVFHL